MTSSNYIAKNTEKVLFQEDLTSGSIFFKKFLNDGHFA
jgi:hypothetical protein